MAREITLNECALVNRLQMQMAELAADRAVTTTPYEGTLDYLIAIARPKLRELSDPISSDRVLPLGFRCSIGYDGSVLVIGPMASAMIFYTDSETPPASLSPDAPAGEAAAPLSDPPKGGGGLTLSEPPAHVRDPRASGPAAAANPGSGSRIPSATEAELFTGAGLRAAVHQMWADIGEGHFQPDQHNWAEDVHQYIIREMHRQSDQAALEAAQKAVAA